MGCVQLAVVLKLEDITAGPPHLLTTSPETSAAAHQQIQPAVFLAVPPHSIWLHVTFAVSHSCSALWL